MNENEVTSNIGKGSYDSPSIENAFVVLADLLGFFGAFLDAKNELNYGFHETGWTSQYHMGLKPGPLHQASRKKLQALFPKAFNAMSILTDRVDMHGQSHRNVLASLEKDFVVAAGFVADGDSFSQTEGRDCEHRIARALDVVRAFPLKSDEVKPVPETGRATIPPHAVRANRQYDEASKHASDQGNELKTDRDVYNYYKDRLADAPRDLPAFESWARSLRKCRKLTNTSKNHPRAGRTGRSIIDDCEHENRRD